jgi:hypothetical protein
MNGPGLTRVRVASTRIGRGGWCHLDATRRQACRASSDAHGAASTDGGEDGRVCCSALHTINMIDSPRTVTGAVQCQVSVTNDSIVTPTVGTTPTAPHNAAANSYHRAVGHRGAASRASAEALAAVRGRIVREATYTSRTDDESKAARSENSRQRKEGASSSRPFPAPRNCMDTRRHTLLPGKVLMKS